MTVTAALLDVDGTLVDSNDAHAHAWVKAFAEAGVRVEFARVRRSIGMGGDKLMPEVSGLTEDSPEGERIAIRRREIFTSEYLPSVKPFRDADTLVAGLRGRGLTVVAASSAKKDELKRLLAIAGAASLLDGATSSDDAEESKPDPDIVQAALGRAKVPAAVCVDSPPDARLRWNARPLPGVTSMEACGDPGCSDSRIMMPALVQGFTLWTDETRATISPSAASVA